MRLKGYSMLHGDCQQLTIESVAATNVKFFTDNGGNLNEVKLDELWFGTDSNGEKSWKFKLNPESNRKNKEISIEESGGDLSVCTVFRSILRSMLGDAKPIEEFNNNVTLWSKQVGASVHVALVYHTPLRSNPNMVQLPIKTYVEMTKLGYHVTNEADCDVIENTYKLENITLIHADDHPLKEIKLSELRTEHDNLIGYYLTTKDAKPGAEKSIMYLPNGETPKSICSLAHWVFANEFNSASRFDDFTVWKNPGSDHEIALLYYKPQQPKKETANGLATHSKPEGTKPPFNKRQAVGGATLVIPALTIGYYLHRRARKAPQQTKANVLKIIRD
jgi:hypothetical protein